PPWGREPPRLPRRAAHLSGNVARAPAHAGQLLGRALSARSRRRRPGREVTMRRTFGIALIIAVLTAGCGNGSSPSPAAAPKPAAETRPDGSPNVAIEGVPPQMRGPQRGPETSGHV